MIVENLFIEWKALSYSWHWSTHPKMGYVRTTDKRRSSRLHTEDGEACNDQRHASKWKESSFLVFGSMMVIPFPSRCRSRNGYSYFWKREYLQCSGPPCRWVSTGSTPSPRMGVLGHKLVHCWELKVRLEITWIRKDDSIHPRKILNVFSQWQYLSQKKTATTTTTHTKNCRNWAFVGVNAHFKPALKTLQTRMVWHWRMLQSSLPKTKAIHI